MKSTTLFPSPYKNLSEEDMSVIKLLCKTINPEYSPEDGGTKFISDVAENPVDKDTAGDVLYHLSTVFHQGAYDITKETWNAICKQIKDDLYVVETATRMISELSEEVSMLSFLKTVLKTSEFAKSTGVNFTEPGEDDDEYI